MPESESFDAFYARTVWNVTSQMHALADEDGLADHAIREAYARAYQQWYEVSGSSDSEAWVLDVAKVAYDRRRAEAGGLHGSVDRAPGHDPLTWPGMFRPAPPATSDPPATLTPDPAALAGPATLDAVAAGPLDASAAGGPVQAAVPPGSLFGSPAPGGGLSSQTADWAVPPGGTPTAAIADYASTPPTSGTPPATSRLRARQTGRVLPSVLPSALASRRNIIAAAAAAAILLAGVIVYATGGHSTRHGATPGVSASAVAKPTVHMLPAGRTAGRATIPWSLVGSGWTLAEVSTAQPDADGAAGGGGQYVIYLVDPEGGRYRILTRSGGAAPDLLAWSGDARTALYAVGGAQGGSASGYGLLTLSSGQLTTLVLPAGVTVLGFTRPDGLNLLAVRQKGGRDLLERYSLAGAHQATIGSVPRPAGATGVLQGNALSSPDGTTAVWGVSGREMQLVSNVGGLIRRLSVPGTGTVPSCTPISWWSSETVLAFCNAAGTTDAGRLWLVPAGGGAPTPLTGISGSASGVGDLTGAWQAGGSVYVTATTAAQCSGAASGPGGEHILQLGSTGTETAVSVPGSPNYHAAVVAGVGQRLLILAQTSCPGTSSLIWLNPSTHAAQTVLTAPATQVGVVDAVPYGSGPTATTNGLN
ncbi:MAG TPA: hypothetical protein VK802_21655 [Streptosporangiaceae bacterium]|jgi:hypothetical protein|nr:hypothetical protein [Streptosporangiaceae bacterium]